MTITREGAQMGTEEKKDGPESFAAMLATIRPKTDVELAEKLSALIEEVKFTGKKGTLSVTFEIKPVDGGGQLVIVNDRISVKPPERTREGSTAFLTDGNGLSRTDPTTAPLFTDEDIRDANVHVDYTTGEIKETPEA